MTSLARRAALLSLPFVAAWPAVAQAPELAMLDTLARGAWEVKFRPDGSTRRICLRDGRELIQLRHAQRDCERYVVQDDRREVTVQYTCAGNGYGRTTIRSEGPRLVQLRSQGIQAGEPFSIQGEARWVGAC